MTEKMIGNEENMTKVREAMELHKQMQLGGELKEGVTIDYVSLFGNHYKGVVVFKKPTVRDYMRIGALESEYFRQAGVKDIELVDPVTKDLAHMISTLSVVAVKRPEWLLKLDEVEEIDVLTHVFNKFMEWMNSFRKPFQGTASDDSETSAREEAMDTA